MQTETNKTETNKTEKVKSNAGVAPIDATSDPEQTLTASEAIAKAAVLAQSYTMDDVKSAAQSARRGVLRQGLKALLNG